MSTSKKFIEGLIYMILSPSIKKAYIGSTTTPIKKRISHHESCSNNTTSRVIIKQKDYRVKILERFKCNSRKELVKREGTHQLNFNKKGYILVNRMIAGRTMTEYRNDKYNYIHEKINCLQCGGKYTRTNISHHMKCRKHLESLKPKTIDCLKCGGRYTKTNLSHHIKSKKHIESLKTRTNLVI